MDRILLVYTGGTFGMAPSIPGRPDSPLAAMPWERLLELVPTLEEMTEGVDVCLMPPIDSSDMNPAYWLNLARAVAEAYASHAGFVIIHGTDTMAYSASALSFLLPDLGKPVVLTGASQPAADKTSDALDNLASALRVACPEKSGLRLVPEVTVCFGSLLLRGNRTRKFSTKSKETFRSPNFAPLGHVGSCASINASLLRPPGSEVPAVQARIDTGGVLLDVFPGMPMDLLRATLELPGLSGVVLRTFGSGNAPSNREFLAPIERACARGVVVANVTQCIEGGVNMGNYSGGAALQELGVVSGGDITPEAALTKLQVLLGQHNDTDTVRRLFVDNLCGERSY